MLRWLPKRVRVSLQKDRIALVHLTAGGNPSAIKTAVIQDDGCSSPAAPPMHLLSKTLAQPSWEGSRLEIVLSHQLCRFAWIPPGVLLRNAQEEDRFVRLRIAQDNGSLPDGWTIALSRGNPSQPRIACAIDGELVKAADAAAHDGGCRIASLQPLLVAAYNSRRDAIARRHLWFVTIERGRCCIGRIKEGQWRSLRLRRLFNDSESEVKRLLEQERLLADESDLPEETLICAPGMQGLDLARDDQWSIALATRMNVAPEAAVALEGYR